MSGNSVRILIQQFQNGEMTSSDGSYGDFRIVSDCSPVCNVSPISLDFSVSTIGQSQSKTFTIENTGYGILEGDVWEYCGNEWSVSPGSYYLSENESETFTVTYSPQDTGDDICEVETDADCLNVWCSGNGPQEIEECNLTVFVHDVDGQLTQDAVVDLYSCNWSEYIDEAITNSDGFVVFEDLPYGGYSYRVQFLQEEIWELWGNDDCLQLNTPTMQRGFHRNLPTISGSTFPWGLVPPGVQCPNITVTNWSEYPYSSALIQVYMDRDHEDPIDAECDHMGTIMPFEEYSGLCCTENVEPGDYYWKALVEVSAPVWGTSITDVTTWSPAFTIGGPDQCDLSVYVDDIDGASVEGAIVKLYSSDWAEFGCEWLEYVSSAVTNSEGEAILSGVPYGRYSYRVFYTDGEEEYWGADECFDLGSASEARYFTRTMPTYHHSNFPQGQVLPGYQDIFVDVMNRAPLELPAEVHIIVDRDHASDWDCYCLCIGSIPPGEVGMFECHPEVTEEGVYDWRVSIYAFDIGMEEYVLTDITPWSDAFWIGGTSEDCIVSPTELEFITCEIGETSEQALTIENSGTVPISGSISIDGGGGDFSLSTYSYNLNPGEVHTSYVYYSPSDYGNDECDIVLSSPCPDIHCKAIGPQAVEYHENYIGYFADPCAVGQSATSELYVPFKIYLVAVVPDFAESGITAVDCGITGLPESLGFPHGQIYCDYASDLVIGNYYESLSIAWEEPVFGSCVLVATLELLAFDEDWIGQDRIVEIVENVEGWLAVVDDEFAVHEVDGCTFILNPTDDNAGSCGDVSTALIDFDAYTDGNAIKIIWEESSEAGEIDYNLTCTHGIEEWSVPFFEEIGHRFVAVDNSGQLRNGEEFVYSLWENSGNEQSLLRQASVVFSGQGIRALALHVFPNPGNPAISVALSVPEKGPCEVAIFDLAGRRVKDLLLANLDRGVYELQWDGKTQSGIESSSGIYVVHARMSGASIAEKITLLR